MGALFFLSVGYCSSKARTAAPGSEEAVCLVSKSTHSAMENYNEHNLHIHTLQEDEEDEDWSSSDSEIIDALDWLDSKDEEEGFVSFSLTSWRPNAHGGHHLNSSTLQPRSNRNQKFSHHIRASPLEEWEGRTDVGMSNSVTTAIRGSVRDMAIGKTKTTEKADRATVEQAIDPRTRMVLFKMLNRGFILDINGCISTGKEANVYHATKSNGQELAIKIYKTSALNFRDRDKYVQGDFRFRNGYCKHNPRKMVKTWAEKEMRNLMRLKAAGIRCPAAYLLRLHVLAMEFIGRNGWAAPRLKDADLSLDKLREGYVEIIIAMRTLYQKCKLVHGDLSEYNILYFEGHLYIIDVSQSVDPEHPLALDFLREDCDFFKKHGVAVMTIRELFDFIVDPSITDDAVDSYLEEMQQKILARGGDITVEDEIADSLFMKSFIPKTLEEVEDAEEDVQRIINGEDTQDLYYQTITGLKHALSLAQPSQQKLTLPEDSPGVSDDKSKLLEDDATCQSSDDEDDESDSKEDSFSGSEVEAPADKKAARKEARKENKKKVKEEKREARKSKVPKAMVNSNLKTDPSTMYNLLKSYALSSSNILKAHHLFHQIHRPTLSFWNLMIRGWSHSDQPIEAIRMYNLMYRQGLLGNNLTYPFLFKACARVSDVSCATTLHARVLKLGFESLLFVSNALIHMYASCGHLALAQKVFDEMPQRDLVSWNSLICGYGQCKRFREVLGVFEAMRVADVKGDAVTMVKVVLSCSFLGEWGVADAMVDYIEENNVEIDVYLGNTLIDMYGRRGLVHLARGVFDRMQQRNLVSWNAMIMGYGKVGNLVAAQELFGAMPQRDVISWTSMITGYSQASQFPEAVRLFKEMMEAKVKPDEITVASVLSACAHIGSLDVGEAVHDYIRKYDVKADVYVGNALIDMYCKCGVVEKALEVFKEMRKKDSVSWTSIIAGLAVNGFADSALDYFSQMLREGVWPSHGTFVGILLACAHAGLVDKGLEYFESMEKVYGLKPEMKHYGCVVDLLSRSGNLQKAYEFIKEMPLAPDVVVWRILLSASQVHGNISLAEIATKKLLELDPSNSGNYVLSSNTYAGSNRWEDVIKMRGLMDKSNVQKPSGSSSIEINGSNSSQDSCFIKLQEKNELTVV
ncbi:Pentatricopeptide repeat-containing protein, mitochondrial, partial [Mucuna pruriens]